MTRLLKTVLLLLSAGSLSLLGSCAHVEPIPDRVLSFEEGFRALAANLAGQVEKSSVGSMVNKVVNRQLKKMVLDPFIDVESGYPIKANTRIEQIMSKEIEKRFEIPGELEPETLQVSEYVLNGMITLDDKKTNVHKVYSTVFEKSSGKVLASASVRISGIDTTPKDIYKDSPVFLKGESYKHYTASVKRAPGEKVDEEYFNGLTAKSMRTKGDNLYEQKEYRKSLSYYNQAANMEKGQQLEVLNGQFTNYRAQGQLAEAEEVYGKLLRVSVAETGEIESKIVFAPGEKEPLESNAALYHIYMRQIATFVVSLPQCRLKIVGHSSRTGTEAYNDKLSQERALWIQKHMSSYSAQIGGRSTAIGRGFRENIVGTGRDDVTDQIDRRVEFVFMNCSE